MGNQRYFTAQDWYSIHCTNSDESFVDPESTEAVRATVVVSTGLIGILRSAERSILGDPSKYFDPNAFILPPVGTLGNAGRNCLIGPGLVNLDFALRKDTKLGFLGEGGNLEFRVEAFNLLNHQNFAVPGNVVFSGNLANATEAPLATAGHFTSTATESRQIQLSLRISW